MIPVCRPTLLGNEKEYVVSCIEDNWISSNGQYIGKFEIDFPLWCGSKWGVACSNGTTALHLALRCLDIKEGDEVIVPDFSIISTANAVKYCGATPVFVDSELDTWNMNPEGIEQWITNKTKAIIVVHTYGCPADMDKIMAIAKKYNLKVIEDAAEAHGAEYKGNRVGSLGDIACFSFYANKIITCGEGGMLVTKEKKYYDKAKSLRNLAFQMPRFIHHDIGYNYRMTNIQAAIGCAQLENADDYVNMRKINAQRYTKVLETVPGITTPPDCPYGTNVYWMYGILVDEKEYGMSRDELMKRLEKNNIQTRTFFYPTHAQPIFGGKFSDEYKNSRFLWENGLYLPSSSDLTEEEIEKISFLIKQLARTTNGDN